MNDQNSSGMTKWGVLLGAIIVQLILGTVYGYSIFWQPLQDVVFPEIITQASFDQLPAADQVADNYHIVVDDAAASQAASENQGALKWAFSICILAFALFMVVAGRIQDAKGPTFPAIIGAVLMGIGFLLAYVALKNPSEGMGSAAKVYILWITIGLIAGAGIGFAYVCPIAALVKWFPEHKGLVSGVAVAGFGFGAYLFKGTSVIGATGFIKANGIEQFFLVHALVCLVGVSIGALLLKNPPAAATAAASAGANNDSTWKDTLKRPAFYVIWLMFFSGAMAGLMVIGILKPFAGEQLVTAAGDAISDADKSALLLKGAAAVGWLAIFNAVGRVLWGFISDRIGRTPSFVAMFIFQAIMLSMLAGMKTEMSLAIAASIVGFNFGGNFALFPSATADLFGAKNMGANYGWVFTSYGIAGVIGVAAGNIAKAQTGSYAAAFYLAAGLCLVSAVLAIGLAVATRKPAATPAAEPEAA